MPRKSALSMQADGAFANLQCIHDLAVEAQSLGERKHAVYLRNATDCARWCETLRKAGRAYPPFMYAGGLNYFGHMWRLPAEAK